MRSSPPSAKAAWARPYDEKAAIEGTEIMKKFMKEDGDKRGPGEDGFEGTMGRPRHEPKSGNR